MKKKVVFFLFYLAISGLNGQNAISGYIDIDNFDIWGQKVHLTKIGETETSVATVEIQENGFFAFNRKYISDKNTMYRIYVNRRNQDIGNDTMVNDKVFILSKKDIVQFASGTNLFSGYENSNLADAEWRRLLKFENNLKKNYENKIEIDSSAFVTQIKNYAKDSVQILMVKLIGIKQLENKNLLEKAIDKYPEYYLALLQELTESELERSEYLFLERRLAHLTQDVVEKKYQLSRGINILAAIIIVGLLCFVIVLKRKKTQIIVDLSKQEKKVHALILEGKSNKEIANELFISLSTVKTHIGSIYSKMKVSNRQELIQIIHN